MHVNVKHNFSKGRLLMLDRVIEITEGRQQFNEI